MPSFDAVILANFGGPRSLDEVFPFLKELLTDRDVIWTPFPKCIHNYLFTKVAKKRSITVQHDYTKIGGKSPIFEDTEAIAKELEKLLGLPVIAFHRYLTATHASFFQKLTSYKGKSLCVFPLYPQFSYATTGSIARFLDRHMGKEEKLFWIRSYPDDPRFLRAYQRQIAKLLEEKGLKEEEVGLLFSCHGIPKRFVESGDVYQKECEQSFQGLKKLFPQAEALLSYQSQFGKEEWLRPYTADIAKKLPNALATKKALLVVPLSFTSDHIETLFEIEEQYITGIKAQGIKAYRVPAPNRDPLWIHDIAQLISTWDSFVKNRELIRSS